MVTAVVSIYFWAWHKTVRVLPDKTGSRPASEKSLRTKDKNMHQGGTVSKKLTEKRLNLTATSDAKAHTLLRNLFLWKELGMEEIE